MPSEYERLLDKHIEAVKHIHCLWEDIDAECRVSQMLLAEQKKLQDKIVSLERIIVAAKKAVKIAQENQDAQ